MAAATARLARVLRGIRTTRWALYLSCDRRSPQPASRKPRFRRAFTCTHEPGFSSVPLAVRVMFATHKSSTKIVPVVFASVRRVSCCYHFIQVPVADDDERLSVVPKYQNIEQLLLSPGLNGIAAGRTENKLML